MIYTLAVMMCLGGGPDAECRYFWMDFDHVRDCAVMKNTVIMEAKREGFRVKALCHPVAKDASQ